MKDRDWSGNGGVLAKLCYVVRVKGSPRQSPVGGSSWLVGGLALG